MCATSPCLPRRRSDRPPPHRQRYNKAIEGGKAGGSLADELVAYEKAKGLDHMDFAKYINKCAAPGTGRLSQVMLLCPHHTQLPVRYPQHGWP